VLSTLDHPLVPRYLEHFEENGALYLVMEKIEGETLDAIRRREGPLPEAEVRRFLSDADRALTYLHGRASPIVHRDIKPRNVVRRPNGSYVLVDFGSVSELVTRRAGASTVVGTMGYMAPEQFQGRAMPSTDVYAAGATALAALTGAEPETLPHKGLRVDVRGALEGRVAGTLVGSLEQMLEPDPDLRAKSVAVALDSMHPAAPPLRVSVAAPAPVDSAKEDALVKSLRKLLWLLWGLGWVLVPVVASELHAQRAIPVVMFGSLAAIFIVTWHKGALLRVALHALAGPPAAALPPAPQGEATPRHRVESGPDYQVRVRATELRHEELVGPTELRGHDAEKARRQQRR